MDGRTRALYEEFSQEAIEVLRTTQVKGSAHLKIHCRHLGYEFTYVASINSGDERTIKNRKADLRRIKRAIRKQDQTILAKFKVKRSTA